jgi:hypothetical protein
MANPIQPRTCDSGSIARPGCTGDDDVFLEAAPTRPSLASFPLLLVSVPLRDNLEGIFLLPVDAGVEVAAAAEVTAAGVAAAAGFWLVLGVAVEGSMPEACS